jgi:signal transduction histidine kinase/streptogramin lyase
VFVSGKIYRKVDATFREAYRLPVEMGRASGFRVLHDRDGGLWVGTLGGGLARLHEGRIEQLSRSDGLSSDSIDALFQDREGTLWVGTHAGLDRFRELPITPLLMRQGLSGLRIFAVLASTDSVWVRTVDGVNQLSGGSVTSYNDLTERSNRSLPVPSPLLENTTHNNSETSGSLSQESGGPLFQDERGRIWLSTPRAVGYLDKGRFVAIRGVPGGRVSSIAGDLKGNLWFAHQTQGLFHLAGERVVDHITWSQLGHSDYADSLAVDTVMGGLWLGFFRGGVDLLKDGNIRASYAAANGLAPGRVNDIRFSRDGALWVAAEGGVSRLKGGRVATLSSDNGLPCTEAHWTIEDDAGDLWLYMPCGLARIARAELNGWTGMADGDRPSPARFRPTVFGSSDGVRSRANGGPFGPPVAKAPDGKLWFFPLEGLSVIDPRHLSSNTLAPPIAIEQISADGQIYQPSSGVRLPALIRDLEIDYTALSLVAPDKVMFRIKLEGRDQDWQDVGNRRQAFYNNLPPGEYRFRVIATNNSGVWNEDGAVLDFSVAPAYYQTTWFRVLAISALIALVWGGHRVRLRIVEKHQGEITALNERLMLAQEQERIRIAGELHDGVMQEMLAVTMILGTAKRRISDPSQATATIDKAQQKLLRVGADLRQLSHGLHPPLLQEGVLTNALHAYCEQFSIASGIPVSCSADERVDDLSRSAALAIFRIVQEALGNAAKHAAAKGIVVRLTRSDNVVSLTVSDDGVGFDRGRLGNEGGLGLIMMRERAGQLSGTFDFETAPGRGTKISVAIPFQ